MSRAHAWPAKDPLDTLYETAYEAYESGGYKEVTDAVIAEIERRLDLYVRRAQSEYNWFSDSWSTVRVAIDIVNGRVDVDKMP